MNLATKAAWLNVFLFPGWGQIYLKRYKRGLLIIAGIVACVLSIFWSIIQAVIDIFKINPLRKGIATFNAVIQLLTDAVKSLNLLYLSLILFFMMLLWILSIIDAYMLGKEEMAKSSSPADQESVSPPV